MSFASTLNDVAFAVFILTFIYILISNFIDLRKERRLSKKPFVSFIMSIYNDSDSLENSIKSIYLSYPKDRFELIVVDDKSTDGSSKKLKSLKRRFRFRMIENDKNLGKAISINKASRFAKGEVICIVDSDVALSRAALVDMLSRLQDEKVGAASCRYRPNKKGFWESMQSVEYGMISLIQRSSNPMVGIGLWGGCLAVKRDVFNKVGMFSKHCLIEDVELAIKIGELGFKSHECSVAVYSSVPGSSKSWFKQKMRWFGGSAQNFLLHPKYFLKHPLSWIFLLTYLLFALSFVVAFLNNIVVFKNYYFLFDYFIKEGYSLYTAAGFAKLSSGIRILKIIGVYLLYPLFSIPYVLMNNPIEKKPHLILLVFPYSIIYIPIFTITSIIGFIRGIYLTLKIGKNQRAW